MKELDLFNAIKAARFTDLVKAEGEYSVFDCVSEEAGMYIELKCRATHYDELLIEKNKYDRLVAAAKAAGKKPVYLNSTPKGVWMWDLSDVEFKWEDRGGLPKTTQFANNTKIVKTVGYLHIKDGEQISLTGEGTAVRAKPKSTGDAQLDYVNAEGESLRNQIDGHKAAIEVYKKFDMVADVYLVEQKLVKLEEQIAFFRNEWRRLTNGKK
jgi:Holliday junction resolvase